MIAKIREPEEIHIEGDAPPAYQEEEKEREEAGENEASAPERSEEPVRHGSPPP